MNINPSVSHSHACLCTARFIVNISHHHGNDRTLQTTYCYACFVVRRLVFFFFWASCSNHCLDGLHLGADVEQSFDCLIVQNRQPMLSMGRSIDWTLKDNMVEGFFFCPTLTGRRVISHLYKQERKRPTPVPRRLSRPRFFLGGPFREGGAVKGWKCGVLWGCPPTRIPLVIRPLSRKYVVVR